MSNLYESIVDVMYVGFWFDRFTAYFLCKLLVIHNPKLAYLGKPTYMTYMPGDWLFMRVSCSYPQASTRGLYVDVVKKQQVS